MVRKDTVCHLQNAQRIKLEFIFPFIRTLSVSIRKSDASDTQAESSLPSRP